MKLEISVLKMIAHHRQRFGIRLRRGLELLLKQVFGKPEQPPQRPVLPCRKSPERGRRVALGLIPYLPEAHLRGFAANLEVAVEKEADLVEQRVADTEGGAQFFRRQGMSRIVERVVEQHAAVR